MMPSPEHDTDRMAEKSASVVGRHVKAAQASFFRHEASEA
jgi:hypothetical protein